jgi:hypothetical protein
LFVTNAGTTNTENNKCYNRYIDGILDPSKYNPIGD